MQTRSWRWLRIRVEQLLTVPPHAYGTTSMPATRLGLALFPPKKTGGGDG